MKPLPPTTIDACGLLCPEPVRLAEQHIRAMEAGQLLRIMATDPAAPIDLEAWCLRRQHEFIACEARGSGWEIRIKKGAKSIKKEK